VSSPVLWYATRATGLVAMLLLTATILLGIFTTARFHRPNWPRFAQQSLHRNVSLLTLAFVTVHVLTSVLDTYVHIGWSAIFVPFASHYRPFWVGLGSIALDLFLAVLISSVVRHWISARIWRGLHWLAYASWPVAIAHGIGTGTDAWRSWSTSLTLACVLAVIVSLVWRVSRPLTTVTAGGPSRIDR